MYPRLVHFRFFSFSLFSHDPLVCIFLIPPVPSWRWAGFYSSVKTFKLVVVSCSRHQLSPLLPPQFIPCAPFLWHFFSSVAVDAYFYFKIHNLSLARPSSCSFLKKLNAPVAPKFKPGVQPQLRERRDWSVDEEYIFWIILHTSCDKKEFREGAGSMVGRTKKQALDHFHYFKSSAFFQLDYLIELYLGTKERMQDLCEEGRESSVMRILILHRGGRKR